MKKILVVTFLLCSFVGFSQKPDSMKTEPWEKNYRPSAAKINDLVHTKLEVSFDYNKSWMFGKAWLTLHPHFYSTDSLNLDARGMQINEVSMVKSNKKIPLKYVYDDQNLRIVLDRNYKGGENYTVFIDYIAKPNEIKSKESTIISSNKGLYFINPLGKDKNKPTQIWTQGETESNSGWVPTIDKPNQKTTDEISMTVPGKYQTLSNGILASQRKNRDGTRTDIWKMDLPHAPYLMMMVVGEYAIIKDRYKGKEVSYYVEKEYAPLARKIFGLTPEMIDFYSRITGVEYPWPKYAQVVCRDFSGAMENTTATIHAESAQQDARQLIDGNNWEFVIAHELFHQWFGDYVTTESWSNTTVNESFADLSETLWTEYKYGKEAGDELNYRAMQNYLQSGGEHKELVRFYYKDREQMFDMGLTYNKGGRILNMLRNYVGDSAFYQSLHLYLETKKFQSAEAHDVRLAFEEVTGQDMNWFWNQWYYGSGHPKLDISYKYDEPGKMAKVFIRQTQTGKPFRFLVAVDVYQGGELKRYKEWIEQMADTLSFPVVSKPDLINVDGDKILLCEKSDHKTLENFIFQFDHAKLYADKREAIDFASVQKDAGALDLMKRALKDEYHKVRIYAIQKLNLKNDSVKNAIEPLLVDLAMNDTKSLVRAEAITTLGKYKKDSYKEFFLKSIGDSSYSIAANSLLALGRVDSLAALTQAKRLSSQHYKGSLSSAINSTLYSYSDESEFDSLALRFDQLPVGYAKYGVLQPFANFLKRVDNNEKFRRGIDLIAGFRDSIPIEYAEQIFPYFNDLILAGIASSKQFSGLTEQAEYVYSKMPARPKPPKAIDVPKEIMQKYVGDYKSINGVSKIVLKDDKLYLIPINGSVIELIPVSKNKFCYKNLDGFSSEFIFNDQDEVTEIVVTTPNGQVTTRKIK
jgi:aminopeptidase N